MVLEKMLACPCGALDRKGRNAIFQVCCGRFLDTESVPRLDGGAVELMRSRYSAFVLARSEYLRSTWHVSTRPESLDFDANVRWLGLEVREHLQVLDADPPTAMVRFFARYRDGSGRAVRMQERSRFVYEADRWWYIDGQQME